MNSYRCLTNQNYSLKDFSIVPLRHEDRYDIMKWRNEQIYHLRQGQFLLKENQDTYFDTVVQGLFDQETPPQILFSFLSNGLCIGYGGLVHMDWMDMHAEISFLMNTELENEHFTEYWGVFLNLIEKVAFKECELHKIYTFAYDLRPRLYNVLESSGYHQDGRLREHVMVKDEYYDVVIHSKLRNGQ